MTSENIIDMAKITELQKQLMDKVPHDVTKGVYAKMSLAALLMEKTVLYLTSCGHKPWRPEPLSKNEQATRLDLIVHVWAGMAQSHYAKDTEESDSIAPLSTSRPMISGFGIIEETLEYMSARKQGDRKNQLEEITDILFFYTEQVILSGFTWADIESEYVRKHAINLKRYEDGKKGDYGWDKREEGKL